MSNRKNMQAFPPLQAVNDVVFMQGITSNEYYLRGGSAPTSILQGIDLTVKREQVFGIDGNSLFELKLLSEIMANIRSYKSGRCVLFERGMMRRKRIILPHVFYIGNPNMAYEGMNVLEFLMFSLMKQHGDKIVLQEQMLDYLIDIGLQRFVLTPIYNLSREHKAVVLLLVSAFSQSNLVVFNLPDYRYDADLKTTIAYIAQQFIDRKKTLVLSTQDPDLIEKACTHMAFLLDGQIEYSGTVSEFRNAYDHVLLTILDDHAAEIAEMLYHDLPEFDYAVHGDELVISGEATGDEDIKKIYRQLFSHDITPQNLHINSGSVQNAREEFVKQHAVHQELL